MTTLDRVLGESLTNLAQLICDVCQPRLLAQASPVPLSRNQFAILKILGTRPTCAVGELAALLNISCAAISKNVDRLEDLGFVERLAKPEDRRGLDVVLLPDGRGVIDNYRRLVDNEHAVQFGQFTADDKERLLTCLRRIIHSTLAQEAPPDRICLLCEGHGAETCVVRESKGSCLHAEGQ